MKLGEEVFLLAHISKLQSIWEGQIGVARHIDSYEQIE